MYVLCTRTLVCLCVASHRTFASDIPTSAYYFLLIVPIVTEQQDLEKKIESLSIVSLSLSLVCLSILHATSLSLSSLLAPKVGDFPTSLLTLSRLFFSLPSFPLSKKMVDDMIIQKDKKGADLEVEILGRRLHQVAIDRDPQHTHTK